MTTKLNIATGINMMECGMGCEGESMSRRFEFYMS